MSFINKKHPEDRLKTLRFMMETILFFTDFFPHCGLMIIQYEATEKFSKFKLQILTEENLVLENFMKLVVTYQQSIDIMSHTLVSAKIRFFSGISATKTTL